MNVAYNFGVVLVLTRVQEFQVKQTCSLFRHLHPNMFTVARNWSLIQKK